MPNLAINRPRNLRLHTELAPYRTADFVPIEALERAGVQPCELAAMVANDLLELHDEGIRRADIDLVHAWLIRDWQSLANTVAHAEHDERRRAMQ
jgi:hypothetical protein